MRFLNKFSNKIVLIFMIATLIPLSLISFYGINIAEDMMLNNLLKDFKEDSLFMAHNIENALSIDKEILIYLADNPNIKRYLIAKKLNNTEIAEIELEAIEHDLLGFSQAQLLFSKVRYIDENGMEVIAIKRDNKGAYITDSSELQDKSYRSFFRETMESKKGELYISKVRLEHEFGKITKPYVLSLIYSYKVFDTDGNNKGFVSLNLDAGQLFQSIIQEHIILQEMYSPQEFMIVDHRGYYVYNINESKQFSSPECLNIGCNLKKDYPKSALIILSEKEGCFMAEDEIVVGYSPIVRGGAMPYILISGLRYDQAMVPIVYLKRVTYIIITVIILFSFLSSVILARRFTKPLIQLAECAKQVSKGNFNVKADMKTGDEIQEFADVFNNMIKSIKEREKEISVNTKELRNSKKEIESSKQKLERNVLSLKVSRTAMLNIMEDINAANEQLKSLDKAKDEFLSVVSHELKTPLTPMKAYLEMLIDKDLGKLNPRQEESVRIIHRNIGRLKLLIDDLLDITRIETRRMRLNFGRRDIRKLIRNGISEMKTTAEKKHIDISSEFGKMPFVEADSNRFAQVLTNLIDNALKFTPSGGSIKINAARKGSKVIVSVKDTGIGISEKNLLHVFEKFYQVDSSLKRKYGGTGLGLCICKGILEQHKGDIWIESELNKGTTVYFSLPIKHNK